MSSGIPYIAPWATQFARYSTQAFRPTHDPPGFTPPALLVVVPDGQWWRPISLYGVLSTDAVAGNRLVTLTFEPGTGPDYSSVGFLAPQGPSYTANYIAGPRIGTYQTMPVGIVGSQSIDLPDVLWPPGTRIFMTVRGSDPGDGWGSVQTWLIETYTENYAHGETLSEPAPIPAATLEAQVV